MDTLNNILRLLKLHKKTQKELCEFLGINGQAFTNWKNGNSESYKKYLPQIAEFFGVTTDDLIGERKKFTVIDLFTKTAPLAAGPIDLRGHQNPVPAEWGLGQKTAEEVAEEAEFMRIYGNLSEQDKKTVLDLMRRLAGER